MAVPCANCGEPTYFEGGSKDLCPDCWATRDERPGGALVVRDKNPWVVRHKKERHFGVVLLLGILTLGIYFLYWHFAVFGEIARHERRSYAWWLYAGSFATFVVSVLYALSRYGMAVEETVLEADAVFVASILAGLILQASYLAVEAKRLNQGLDVQGSAHRVPVYPLPLVIVGHSVFGLTIDYHMVVDIILAPVWVFLYYLLHAGINTYWRGSVPDLVPPAAPAATQA